MIKIFFSYSHADEVFRDEIETQLAMLKRQGVIEVWHDRRILAGEGIDDTISDNLEQADIILILVSADFLKSDYCYQREMTRAMERHEDKDAVVIPVILRACDWHHAPFGKLMAVPKDGRPITQWPDRDQALLDIAQAIRRIAEARLANLPLKRTVREKAIQPPGKLEVMPVPVGARSSNLRLAKTFTEKELDSFRIETFEFIAKFFENSLQELASRNADVECAFRRIDANCFSAIIYRNGKALTRCSVFLSSKLMGNGIAYSYSEGPERNSYNEVLTVAAGEQSMHLNTLGASMMLGGRVSKLSQEGAAEFYWGMLLEPLQRN